MTAVQLQKARGQKRQRHDRIAFLAAAFAALASFMSTAGIVCLLIKMAFDFFTYIPLRAFFADTVWAPFSAAPRFGIWGLVFGTGVIAAVAISVALPPALTLAFYLSEYAPRRLRTTVRAVLNFGAAVPSVIYAYVALVYVGPALERTFLSVQAHRALSAGVTLGLMILPALTTLSEQAVSAVSVDLKEAAFALGASKWRVLTKVVFINAAPGVFIATLLAFLRVFGDAVIVVVVCGPLQTLVGFIAEVGLLREQPSVIQQPQAAISALPFAVALMLFALTLGINAIVMRLRKVYT